MSSFLVFYSDADCWMHVLKSEWGLF